VSYYIYKEADRTLSQPPFKLYYMYYKN